MSCLTNHNTKNIEINQKEINVRMNIQYIFAEQNKINTHLLLQWFYSD